MQPNSETADNTPETKALLLEALGHGHVEILIDSVAAGACGLPAMPQPHLFQYSLAGPDDADDVENASDYLPLPCMWHDRQVHTAQVPFGAIVAIFWRDQRLRQQHALWRALPAWLEVESELAQRWLMSALGWGQPATDVNQFALRVDQKLVLDDADRTQFQPNARRAFRELLERAPQVVHLWVDLDVSGIRMPPGAVESRRASLAGPVRMVPMLLRKSENLLRLRAEQDGVAWTHQDPQVRFDCFVPWLAVPVIQSPLDGYGWWWPSRLPVAMQQEIATRNPQLWPAFACCEGIPNYVLPKQPPPIAGLHAPMPDKARALRATFARGPGFCVVDARVPGCEMPESLRCLGFIAIPFGFAELPPAQLDTAGSTLSAQLVGPEGALVQLRVPWRAVLLVGIDGGSQRYMYSWQEDFPDDMLHAVIELQKMAKQPVAQMRWQQLTTTSSTGAGKFEKSQGHPGVKIGRNDLGEWMISIEQPMGPADFSGKRPKLQAQFHIPAPVGRH